MKSRTQQCTGCKKEWQSTTSSLMSSDQVAKLLTTHQPSTIRELAKRGVLPVDHWEPVFKRDADTIRAILSLLDHQEMQNEKCS